MHETQSNSSENLDRDSASAAASRRTAREVPKRRGSKYADVLLQRLHTAVFSDTESPIVGITSFTPRQGATTTAANLAIRAADHGFTPSLLVDCNDVDRRISQVYRCSGSGFGECINGRASLEQCVKSTKINGLSVLGSGNKKLAKQIMIDHELAREFFKLIRNDYRFSVVDLPGVNEPALFESLAPCLDGIVMVARYGSSKHRLAEMQDRIIRCGGQVAGLVMTGNEESLPRWLPSFVN